MTKIMILKNGNNPFPPCRTPRPSFHKLVGWLAPPALSGFPPTRNTFRSQTACYCSADNAPPSTIARKTAGDACPPALLPPDSSFQLNRLHPPTPPRSGFP